MKKEETSVENSPSMNSQQSEAGQKKVKKK